MTIFNIIVILSISDKELFHFGTFRPSKKNKKIDFNWVTIAYEDKNPTIKCAEKLLYTPLQHHITHMYFIIFVHSFHYSLLLSIINRLEVYYH